MGAQLLGQLEATRKQFSTAQLKFQYLSDQICSVNNRQLATRKELGELKSRSSISMIDFAPYIIKLKTLLKNRYISRPS
jgi:septation ring formation regulator EzrA